MTISTEGCSPMVKAIVRSILEEPGKWVFSFPEGMCHRSGIKVINSSVVEVDSNRSIHLDAADSRALDATIEEFLCHRRARHRQDVEKAVLERLGAPHICKESASSG
jgi:hypothetical protein